MTEATEKEESVKIAEKSHDSIMNNIEWLYNDIPYRELADMDEFRAMSNALLEFTKAVQVKRTERERLAKTTRKRT